ncbi:hypothetical protein [Prosthecobacter sp.]|uniref:hypothetical protein n=1 Tax=Prosthecobacter sp. TaxID=1965333 RepID=UPI002ABB0416|nr:hypothetical protein [Prosthecobacter sp.]MDZ4402645.1 hypothetical protein [Prosthecobacter sp.]
MNGENNTLPTRVHTLSGPLFEQFCCEWLQLSPCTPLLGGEVIHAQPFARSGQNQDGIDIQTDVLRHDPTGEEKRVRVVFQCKRTRDWDADKTRTAISKVTVAADECVLVLAMDAGGGGDGPIQSAINEHNRTKAAGQPHWHVFFISDIERHIGQNLKTPQGARLLTKYFGRGTSFDVLGMTEASPLITELAMMEGFQGSFSHKQKLFGRDAEKKSLLDALDAGHQAILLPAPGGEGKTRLLLEFAKEAAEQPIRRCVRFLLPCTPTELDEAMQWMPPCDEAVIILDDAHRWQPELRAHFERMRLRWGARLRLVIGTRPYCLRHLQIELRQAEIRPIHPLPALASIKRPAQLKLAKAALAPNLTQLAKALVDAAGGSPLIILTGAEHLNKHDGKVNLHQDAHFRREVLHSLFDTPKLATTHGVSEFVIEEALDLLALLSSAPVDAVLEEKAASFMGLTPPDFRRLLDVLKESGHLQIKADAGLQQSTWRLIPDLAADYRACEACFDEKGHAKPLPARFWTQLGSDTLLPAVLRNLSEAEYITRLIHPQASRVTTPLVEALKSEYRQAGWRRRVGILNLWQGICELQPHESLLQAREALRLKNDQPAESPNEIEEAFATAPPSFAQILEVSAGIAETIGSIQLEYVTTCLDLLWEIDGGQYGDLLSKISTICSVACFGPPVFANQAMPWIKARIYDPALLPSHERLGALLHAMLDGCFQLTKMENEWADQRTLQFHNYLLPLGPSKHLRKEVLTICLNWLHSPIWQARQSAAHYFRHFFVPDQMPVKADGARAEDRKAWRQEQARAVSALKKAIPAIEDAATLWALRQTLINSLQSALQEKSGRHGIHDLLEAFPDTLELRIHRLFLSSEESDVPQSVAECSRRALYQAGKQLTSKESYDSIQDEIALKRQTWAAFVDHTTHEVVKLTSDASGLWRFLEEWHPKLEKLGSMSFWAFVGSIGKQQPELLPQLAEHLLASESSTLDRLYQALDHAWKDEPTTRTEWTLRALQSPRKTLALEALRSLRYRRELTTDELAALKRYASHEDVEFRSHVFSWTKEAHTYFTHLEVVFGIIAAVKVKVEEPRLGGELRDCIMTWFGWPPYEGVPHGAEILQKLLLIPDLQKLRLDDLIEAWSRHDPQQVVDYLRARLDHWQLTPNAEYQPFGYLDLNSLDSVPAIIERIDSAFQQLIGAHHSQDLTLADKLSNWFHILGEGAWQTYQHWLSDHLSALHEEELTFALQPVRLESCLPFNNPDLTERILQQAAKQSASCQETVRRCLRSSLHPRSFSAQPGQARGHDLHNRDKALEMSALHRQRPLLRAFYLEIVQNSERAIKRAEEEQSPWPDD